MLNPLWALWVRDANRNLVAPVDEFASASFLLPFNDVGGWMVKGIPFGSQAAQALVPGAGLVAVRNGDVLTAGPLLFPTVRWSEKGYTLDVSGASDDLALWARLCYPDAPSLDLNADYSDDRAGVASTVMRAYVDVNAGPGADVTRRWPGLVLGADPLLGSAVSYTARLAVLGDVLVTLAQAGGDLGFRVVQDVDGTDLTFDVYQPADRSDTARFSPELGNVSAFDYSRKAPQVTRAVVGGKGEGTLRLFAEVADAAAEALWGMRLESFKDQRQTDVPDELEAAGAEELAGKGEQINLGLSPVDTAAVTFGPGPNGYGLGDLVSVFVSGEAIVERVRAVEVVLDATGEKITPTIGTPGAVEAGTSEANALDVLLARMMDMSRRLSRLAAAQ